MEDQLPDDVVRKLNRLGFALVEGERPYTFLRLGSDAELRLLIESIGPGSWRVGAAARTADPLGRVPDPIIPMSLCALGSSSDGLTLDVTTATLRDDLPRMVRDSLLPMWDFGPTGG